MPLELLTIPAIAVAAIVLIRLAGRNGDERSGTRVIAIDDQGLHTDDDVAPWPAVTEVAVLTERTFGRTWFGFEVLAGGCHPLVVDGADDLVEPLLANSHRLPGFNHEQVGAVLTSRRARATCFRR